MRNLDLNPITGRPLTPNVEMHDGRYYVYPTEGKAYDDLLLGGLFAEDYDRDRPYSNNKAQYSLDDTANAWCLARSYLWRSLRNGSKPILVTSEDRQKDYEGFDRPLPFIPITFERLIAEARALTLVDKAVQTLANLYERYRANPAPFPIPYSGETDLVPTTLVMRPPVGFTEDGVAYGCDNVTALFAYEYLAEQGYIRVHSKGQRPDGWLISAKGYDVLDRMCKGRSSLGKRVFFVRRYDEELDTFLVPITKEVGKRVGCDIDAVWSKPHNSRLDEKIFRDIRTASVVLVDVSPTNFNVGLELGYALALGKPIVVIMERPEPINDADTPEAKRKKTLPFDINTLNCFFYDRAKPDELRHTLEARIGLEFDVEELRGTPSP